MGPISFVMVVMACGQGDSCKPMMTMPAAYRSESACLADRADILGALSRPGDKLVAECRSERTNNGASAPVRSSGKARPLA
ncbi:hypothetical protein G7077_06615 [Sphingomonas piscis]|uniref:Uncharacterized protein n=1 Tax=Sphingomonas piscis TaxID=2714943 RepID=A0A6G7YPE7_9SPHN|nr:hypothetical protein [Sphingomonas piscis]QIK78615.1 hypothetical protein G7077_06615 [Sphingomonas piscis]